MLSSPFVSATDFNSAVVRDPLKVSPDTTVMAAMVLMSGMQPNNTAETGGAWEGLLFELRCSCVLVVENDRLLGLLTNRDMLRLSVQGKALDSLSVSQVMLPPVLTLRESECRDGFSIASRLQQQDVRHVPILDDQNRVVGLLMPERVQHKETFYKALAAACPVGIFQTDTAGCCIYVNTRWCEIAGLQGAEAMGIGWVDRLHPEDRDRVIAEWTASVENNRPFELEYRFQNGEGQTTWVYGQAIAERESTGEIVGYVGTITDISDRKQTELSLQEANQQITTIWESMTDAYATLDREWRVIYANPTATQIIFSLTNLEPEAFLGKTHWELFPFLVGKELEREYRRALDEQIATHFELFYEPTGNWFEIHVYPSAVGLGLYFRDISDRRQAEAEHLRSVRIQGELKLLEQILDVILAGYWDWDIPNNQEYLSPGFKQMFGYQNKELPNRPETWQSLIFAEDLPGVLDCFKRHVQSHGEVPYYNEVRYQHKNGSTVWVICSGKVIEWDKAGNPIRMIGCHIDITARKLAEADLIQNRDLREAIFNELADALFLVDVETLLTLDCNQRAAEMFGVEDRAELIGIEGHTLQRYQFSNKVLADIANQVQVQGFWSQELEYVTRQGNFFWGNIAVKPIVVAGNTMNLVRVSDISKAKRDEVVRKRAETTLQQTAIQLAATNRELESFSYSVSHDLRAPLRHLSGFVNALRQQLTNHQILEDPKVAHYLEVIENSSAKMAQLIDGLLSLSRIGRRPMDWQPVSLSDLVEAAIALNQTDFGDDRPSVEFVIGELPMLVGDVTLLQQVFQNLIDNAIKFSRNAAAPRVEIGSEPDGTVWVKDNGAGFQMEYADKLFSAFQRLHTQTEFEGTGIGLAVVQRIVQRHGGTVWAKGTPHQGATFYLKLGAQNSSLH